MKFTNVPAITLLLVMLSGCRIQADEDDRVARGEATASGLFRYDVATGKALPVPGIPKNSEITVLRWSPDSSTLFVGTKAGFFIHDITGAKARRVRGVPADVMIADIAVSPDGGTALVGTSGKSDGEIGKGFYRYDRRRDTALLVSGIADVATIEELIPDHRWRTTIVIASGAPFLYDASTGVAREIAGFPNDTYVRDVLWSANDRTAFIGTAHRGLFRYDAAADSLKRVDEISEGDVKMRMSDDGRTIAAATKTSLFLYDVASGRVVRVETGDRELIEDFELSAGGDLYWGIMGGSPVPGSTPGDRGSMAASVFRYDVAKGTALAIAGTSGINVGSLTWSPAYRTLFIGDFMQGGVKRYDSGSAAALPLEGVPADVGVNTMALGRNGQVLFVGTVRKGLFRYDIEKRNGARVPDVPDDCDVSSLTPSPDGRLVMVDAFGRDMVCHDIGGNTSRTLAAVPVHVLVRKVCWCRDGRTAFIGTMGIRKP